MFFFFPLSLPPDSMNILEPEDEEHTQEEDSSGSNDDEDSQDEEEEEEEEEEEDQVCFDGMRLCTQMAKVCFVLGFFFILKTHGCFFFSRMMKKEMRTTTMKVQKWSWMRTSLTSMLHHTSASKGLTGMMTSS